jgi:hypothetical protein
VRHRRHGLFQRAHRDLPGTVLPFRNRLRPSQNLALNVTEHPTGSWIVQQLREAFPEDRAPQYLILDRDSNFNEEVATMLEYLGSELIRTAYRSPWQNGVAERWVGSCRRELWTT